MTLYHSCFVFGCNRQNEGINDYGDSFFPNNYYQNNFISLTSHSSNVSPIIFSAKD